MTELPNWFEAVKVNFEEWVPKDKPLRVLQIGVYKGDATRWLLDNCNIEVIHDVDTWMGSAEHSNMDFADVEREYDEAIGKDSRVYKYKMTSDQYFAQCDSTFDFVYVDGDHTAPQTTIDGINGLRVLKEGGIIAFDDYGWPHNHGINHPKLGIDAVLSIFYDSFEKVEKNYQVWAWKK